MQKLQKILQNPTSIQIYINTIGNYLNVGFTAIFTLVLFRIMSPADYGVYSVLISVSYVMATILDFGTTATIYSYLPPMIEDKSKSVYRFVKSTFYYQTVFSSVVVIALLFLFPTLDKYILKTGGSVLEMSLAAISIITFIWQNFILNLYFAAKKFLKANIYLNISNVIRGVLIFIAYYTHSVSVSSLIIILGLAGNIAFLLLVLYDRKNDLHNVINADVHRDEFRFKYALTYFIASQFLNVGFRMDLFTLSFFNAIISRADVGFYAAAQKIILTVLTTVISITQVLSPAFTNIKTRKQTREQLKHGLLYMLIPCSLFVGVTICPEIIYEWFFTPKFEHSAAIARVLSLPYIIYAVGSVPMLFLLYTVKKPKPILMAYICFFIVVSVGCYLFIPIYKVWAPPIFFTIGFILAKGLIAFDTWQEYKKLPA
jgi:O-antigen/teichoic acid export membrane protein